MKYTGHTYTKLVILTLAIFAVIKMDAQQDPQYTHYMYNTISVNPGYAGSRGALTAGALHRSQWIGLDGAPNSQSFYVHAPLRKEKIGLGLSVVNDKIGPINQTFINGDIAYRLPVSEHGTLSFGAKASLNMYQPQSGEITTNGIDDPSFDSFGMEKDIAPNVGFGVYYFSDKWYVGLSAPKMVENKLQTASTGSAVEESRHYFMIAGMLLPVNDKVTLKPTLLTKAVQDSPLSVDATVEALIMDKFTAGVGYRFKDAVTFMAGMMITDQLKFGVSYDATTSLMRQINSGSVEVMLQYDFVFKNDMLKTPRHF